MIRSTGCLALLLAPAIWLASSDVVSRREGGSPSTRQPSARQGIARELDASWRETTETPPEFFYADDVKAEVRTALEQAFGAAIDEWGNYGPLEYWVVGADVEAAELLATRFCERRSSLGNESLADCQRYSRQDSEFVEWAERAAQIEHTGQPFLDAGRNGRADWGVHLFSSSYPPAWAGLAQLPVEDDQTVLFHEYFHAVQHAHILSLDRDERDRLLGPVWFVEGGAEFMAQTTSDRLRASGALPRDDRDFGRPWSAKERMRDKMRRGLERLAQSPGVRLADVEYGPDAMIAYDLGAWAVAYLCDKAGPNALLGSFYPKLNELGWEGAFVETFGMTPEAFYPEFEQFLTLPAHEQVKVLP